VHGIDRDAVFDDDDLLGGNSSLRNQLVAQQFRNADELVCEV